MKPKSLGLRHEGWTGGGPRRANTLDAEGYGSDRVVPMRRDRMVQEQRWHLTSSAPEVYERYLVPPSLAPGHPYLRTRRASVSATASWTSLAELESWLVTSSRWSARQEP